jgi:hypothetical protein
MLTATPWQRTGGLFALPGGPPLPDTINLDARLTATQAARYAGVSVQAIINWRNRGYLPRGDDGLYRLLDVAKAEHDTRRRGGRHHPAPI